MTLHEIRALVVSADPDARHYWTSAGTRDYTVWREYEQLPFMSDDIHDEQWRFQIDRFTTVEFDQVAQRIRDTLDAADGVAYSYMVDYEGTPESGGLIHHIFDCQG